MNKLMLNIILYFNGLTTIQRLFGVILLIIPFILPFADRGVISTFTISLFFIWLFSKMPIRNFKSLKSKNRKLILSMGIVYIFYLVGLFYTADMDSAIVSLSIKLSLFIFPIIFATIDSCVFKTFLKRNFLNLFVFGNLINIIILLVNAYLNFQQTGNIKEFFYTKLAFNQHATYTAMYTVFSVFILLENILKSKRFNIYKYILILVFISFIILLSSKAGIISLVILIVFSLFYFMIKYKSYLKTIIAAVLFLSVSFGLYLSFPNVSRRMDVAIDAILSKKEVRVKSTEGTAVRITVWENSLKLIKKSPIFGFGTGNVKNVILNQKQISESIFLNKMKPDSHNQYLQTTLAVGVFGLLSLLYIIIASFIIGLKNGNYLLVVFTLLTAMNWLTESMLERQNGTMFFGLFLSFLLASTFFEQKETSINSISD